MARTALIRRHDRTECAEEIAELSAAGELDRTIQEDRRERALLSSLHMALNVWRRWRWWRCYKEAAQEEYQLRASLARLTICKA